MPSDVENLNIIRLNLIRLQRCKLSQKMIDFILITEGVSTFIHELCEFAICMSDKMERYAEVCVALNNLLPSGSILGALQSEIHNAFEKEVLVHRSVTEQCTDSNIVQLQRPQIGQADRGMRLVHICRFIAHLASKGLYNVQEAKDKFAEAARSAAYATIPTCPATRGIDPAAPQYPFTTCLVEPSSPANSTSVDASRCAVARMTLLAFRNVYNSPAARMCHVLAREDVNERGNAAPSAPINGAETFIFKADMLSYRSVVSSKDIEWKIALRTRENARVKPKRVFGRRLTLESVSTCWAPSKARSGSERSDETSFTMTSFAETEDSFVPERRRPKWAAAHMEDVVAKTIKGLLNRLTEEKFCVISQKLLELDISSEEHMSTLGKGIFEKVTLEHLYINMYTRLCIFMLQELEKRDEKLGKMFRRSLVNECQKTFERCDKVELTMGTTEEDYEKYVKAKERMTGNLKFIGELTCQRVIQSRVVDYCIETLMDPQRETAIEGLIVFLSTIGPVYNVPNPRNKLPKDVVHRFLECDLNSATCVWSTRVKCLVLDFLDKNNSRRLLQTKSRIVRCHQN